jgi:hypothetical protein
VGHTLFRLLPLPPALDRLCELRYRRSRASSGRLQCTLGPQPGSRYWVSLIVAINFRLRPYHRKPRSGAGQFRRILYSCRMEYLRWIFCQCHDMLGRKSFSGRGIWDTMFYLALLASQASSTSIMVDRLRGSSCAASPARR